MNAMKQRRSVVTRMTRVIAGMGAVLMLTGSLALGGCGAPQPPAEGECREWREWVPPQQNDEGEWEDGYCRDRE